MITIDYAAAVTVTAALVTAVAGLSSKYVMRRSSKRIVRDFRHQGLTGPYERELIETHPSFYPTCRTCVILDAISDAALNITATAGLITACLLH